MNQKVIEITEDLAEDGMLDPLRRLKKRRHYIEHGYNDEKFSFSKTTLRNSKTLNWVGFQIFYHFIEWFVSLIDNGRQIAQFFGQYSAHVRYQESSAIHGIVWLYSFFVAS